MSDHATPGHGSHGETEDAPLGAINLASLTGSAFDSGWIAAMTFHHQGAIAMAVTAKEDGISAEIKELTAAIITAQQGGIETM